MSDLVVVANRGPVSARLDENGSLLIDQAAGGLAPSLARALGDQEALWIAAAMTEAERHLARSGAVKQGALEVHLVELPAEVLSGAYNVVANATLWFLYHGMFDRVYRPSFDRRWFLAWDAYRTYNHAFAEEIAKRAGEGAVVVVHDYHLALVGSYLWHERPDLKTVHFSHTPFPEPDELDVLPRDVAYELVGAMCAFGACGFHTKRWAEAFCRSASAFALTPECFVAALGPDPEALREVAGRPSVALLREQLLDRLNGRKLIVRSDRIEPSKNLVRGFLGFEEFLERAPKRRDEMVFVARTYASRTDLPEYLAYRKEVERVVTRINERFAVAGEVPIELHVDDDYEASVAALGCYDALLVNPIRDGMNLVAKEGPILNNNDGVLLLSNLAGAYDELGAYALQVHPYDITNTADGLSSALDMSSADREERAIGLRELASARPPRTWLDEVVEKARPPST